MKRITLLLAIFLCLKSLAIESQNSVTLVSMPSFNILDWESPQSLLKSYLGSGLNKSLGGVFEKQSKFAMGHVVIGVKCKDSKSKEHDFWTGISGQNDNEVTSDLVLKQKIGLGIMFHLFDDGYIQTSEKVLNQIATYYGSRQETQSGISERRQPHYFKFQIDQKQCDDIVDFYTEHKNRSYAKALTKADERAQLPYDKKLYYGSTIDSYVAYKTNKQIKDSNIDPQTVNPEILKMGGGCAPFAVGFIKVAQIYNQNLDQIWAQSVYYTKHLFGEKFDKNLVELGQPEKVSIFELLGDKGLNWIVPDMPVHFLLQQDPEKMWQHQSRIIDCIKKENCELEQFQNNFNNINIKSATIDSFEVPYEVLEWVEIREFGKIIDKRQVKKIKYRKIEGVSFKK